MYISCLLRSHPAKPRQVCIYWVRVHGASIPAALILHRWETQSLEIIGKGTSGFELTETYLLDVMPEGMAR